jgi:hypothetical protein
VVNVADDQLRLRQRVANTAGKTAGTAEEELLHYARRNT